MYYAKEDVMQDLVLYADQVCGECEFEKLVPYKGSEVNTVEPDRLVCQNCGKEYAIYSIMMNGNNARYGKLVNLSERNSLKEFIKTFCEAC